MAPKTPNRSVHEAATAWSKSVFGAPARFADLVRTVQVRDEVIERLLTVIVRRDIREERIPTTQRRTSLARVDPSAVDPFAIAPDALRAASEYITHCGGCGGSGSANCGHCGGGGRARCHNCSGSGQERRYYKKSSRLVKCGICRGGGTVPCGTCEGRGSVICHGCTGSGHQLAWLVWDEATRGNVTVVPNSPILVSHRYLAEGRALAMTELSAFGTLVSIDSQGPLPSERNDAVRSNLVREQALLVDPRFERVSFQQYLKLAVVRRDTTYEMCGMSGVLVLSGCDLLGATTPAATRPIQRRLYLWAACGVGLFVATILLAGGLVGPTAYFQRTNDWVVGASWTAGGLALVFSGAALRELRAGFKFGTLRGFERLVGLGAVAAGCVAVIIAIAGRPRMGEVQQALAAGDTARATLVVQALVATKGESPEVRELEDAISLAQADKLAGEAKLNALDSVASRGGNLAARAAQTARAERLQEIQHAIDARKDGEAVADIDRWFPNWRADPAVAAKRATAKDATYTSCMDDPCRYLAASEADTASTTKERAARRESAKSALLVALSFSEMPGEPLLARLQRLASTLTLATRAELATATDTEVAAKATAAGAFARGERAKVALVATDETVASELLGSLTERDARVATITLNGLVLSLQLDAQKKCRGVYIVGSSLGARELDVNGDATLRLLSQAVGHATSVHLPVGNAAATRWSEGATPVLARWKDGKLMELRIGDATP
jgi:hypothetical protein